MRHSNAISKLKENVKLSPDFVHLISRHRAMSIACHAIYLFYLILYTDQINTVANAPGLLHSDEIGFKNRTPADIRDDVMQ